jgi:diguanylate cyclase (GGDEF)-like protein
MKATEPIADRKKYLEERISYLEEANRNYIAILDMLASSDDFQAELNRGKKPEAIFRASLAQLKRILPFQAMGILENLEDSSFSLAVSEPIYCRDEMQADIDNLIMDGTFSWALNRNQSIIVPTVVGDCSLLLHVVATQARIRGMFIGRLSCARRTIDSPSLNALTITLRSTAHALESCTLYDLLREHLCNLEKTVQERTAELEMTAMELKRANQKLITLSDTDPLTCLYNRRFLMDDLSRKMRRSKKSGESLALIILDIDHFKRINDTYGHQNGDLVITIVAEASQKRMRSHDIVARYGGEEFVIVLPGTTLPEAISIAERLRNSVQSLKMPPPMENLEVTLSLGVAAYPSSTVNDIDSLFRQADEALYRAKQFGRNRVESMDVR